MGEEISTTVKTASDGKVEIALEAYQELVAKAAEKAPVIHRTTVNRTPEVQAKDNVAFGVTCIGLGAALVGVGTYRLSTGLKVLKGLKN